MKAYAQLAAWVAAALALLAVKCSVKHEEPTPEQLIEQHPSGAGPAEELEPRPGYFRKSNPDPPTTRSNP